MDKNSEQIAMIPLFRGLPERQIQDLASIIVEQPLKRGQFIFAEGDEGKGFYVVSEGRIKIFKLSSEGKEQILHIFGPGEPFGEVPVFAGQNFPANAEAMEKSRVLFFPRQAFFGLIEKNPSIAMNMLALLSGRLPRWWGAGPGHRHRVGGPGGGRL